MSCYSMWCHFLLHVLLFLLTRYFWVPSSATAFHSGREMKSTFPPLWNKFLRLEGLNLIDHPQPQFHTEATFWRFQTFYNAGFDYSYFTHSSIVVITSAVAPSPKQKVKVASLEHWKVKFIWSFTQMQGHKRENIQS